jgi:hypothetical protein
MVAAVFTGAAKAGDDGLDSQKTICSFVKGKK